MRAGGDPLQRAIDKQILIGTLYVLVLNCVSNEMRD